MVAAIFDIEGTLFKGQMGRGFIQYARKHGRRLRAELYFLSLMPKYLRYKAGLLPAGPLFRDAIARMAWLIGGYDHEQADQAYDWVAEEFILPSGHPAVLERWWNHRRQGQATFIVSGGLEPCVERIARALQADGYQGTRVELRDGVASGRIIPPVVLGDDKRRAVGDMVAKKALQIDWKASFAYADSLHDLPVLEMVGNPVAVYPDEELARIAGQRGWETIPAED